MSEDASTVATDSIAVTITVAPTVDSATRSESAVTADVGGGTTGTTINGLTAGTEYAVTVTDTNAAGTSDPSDTVNGTSVGYCVPLPPGYSLPGSDGEAPEIDVPDGVELISIISTPSGERG